MKYAFIVNPASGQGKKENGLIPKIEKLIKDNPDRDIKIYYTRSEKDATYLADKIAKKNIGKVVIFACGGDGTIQEVANGVYGHKNAALAIVPVGSGNDFARALGGGMKEGKKFLNLQAQLDAPVRKIDLIKMTWNDNGIKRIRMVDNGINIGFDGNTAIDAHDYKQLPGVTGSGSYILAVGKNLIEKRGEDLNVVVDGKEFFNGPLLLAMAANGGFCGGGFHSCPKADLNDGLMDLFIARDLTRRAFLKIVPKYKNGKIFEIDNENDKIFKYVQAKRIEISPNKAKTMQFVADGEIYQTGKIVLEVVPDAINVVTL